MQRTNEEQLDLFAELIEPAAEIFSDKDIATAARSGKAPILIAKPVIKSHKKALITILAVLDGVNPVEYHVPNPGTLLLKAIALFSKPEIKDLFTLQGQKKDAASSGSAMVNTEDGAN